MELKELASAFAAKMGIDGLTVEDGVCALEIDGIPLQIAETAAGGALENFRPAAEEAAARDEEVPAMGLPASGFISV